MTLSCRPKLINKQKPTEVSDNIQAFGSLLSSLVAVTKHPASSKTNADGHKDVEA